MRPRSLLARIQFNRHNVRFRDLVRLAEALGFVHARTAGSHRIYIHPVHTGAELNLQPHGLDAKPYQVKQLLDLVEEYNLLLDKAD
ncbi:MAG: type II toxin-antitoxin system HicA family toxin [Phycisphaerales bacterium]